MPTVKTTFKILLLSAACLAAAAAVKRAKPQEKPMNPFDLSQASTWNPLTPEEELVIVKRGTETPYTGKYDRHFEPGAYVCRRCGAALYRSEDKFDAGCGWPAFDQQVARAVLRKPDLDGRRTEIICANCNGHLGHVFVGEKLTDADTRHCVNSVSMDFVPEKDFEKRFGTAVFAGGCFWGVEFFLQQAQGVVRAVSGYTGGTIESPTYEQVCSGKTGHIEAVKVVFDPKRTTYEALAKLFFEIHDPTQVDRQGPDVGEQYRSAVFYKDADQKAAAEKLVGQLQAKGLKIATRLEPLGAFWPAEANHQDYYFRKGSLPYCHQRVKRFD